MNTSDALHKESISLDSAVHHILEECRMVLPGIQALFGFQLIVVFNLPFTQKLTAAEQVIHLVSIILIVMAAAFAMAPAAIHRQAEPLAVSRRFIRIASGLVLWSMVSLALGLCLESFLVAKVILLKTGAALAVSFFLFILFFVLWIAIPRRERAVDGMANGRGTV